MNCQLSLVGGGGLSSKELLGDQRKTVCTGCQNLSKEIAEKDKKIEELQFKLSSIHLISGGTACTNNLPKEDWSRKFQIGRNNFLGTEPDIPAPVMSTSNLSMPLVHSSDSNSSSSSSSSSSGFPDVTSVNQKGDNEITKKRRRGKMVTVQEIIDWVIEEKSPKKHEEKKSSQSEPAIHNDPGQVITVQEIIEGVIEKKGKQNELSNERNAPSLCDCSNKLLSKIEPERKPLASPNQEKDNDFKNLLISASNNNNQSFVKMKENCIYSSPLSSPEKEPVAVICSPPQIVGSSETFPMEVENHDAISKKAKLNNDKSLSSFYNSSVLLKTSLSPVKTRYLRWRQYHQDNYHSSSKTTSVSGN